MNSDICVVGASNWDMFTYCDEMPKHGETIKGRDFKTSFGGKAANQAIQAAKLGSQVSIVTKLGDDIFGKNTMENFRSHQIDITSIKVASGAPSGIASITVDGKGENYIIIVGGSNDLLSEEDIENSKPTLLASKYVLCQLEITLQTTLKALKCAKSGDQSPAPTTILNATPISDDPLLKSEIFKFVDILIVNEVELITLMGEDSGSASGVKLEDIYSAAESLIHQYDQMKHVIVTLGARGQVLVSRETGSHFIEIQEKVEKVVDTTGAGDSFIGSFVHYLHQDSGNNLIDAIKRASRVASISVQRYGTQTSYPDKDELERMFK